MSYPLGKAQKNLIGGGGYGGKKLKPGSYTSEIIEVKEKPGYVKGQAFVIVYRLTDDNGNEYEKTETFINDFAVPRTKAFVDYVEDSVHELEVVEDLVGLKEKVSLEYEVITGKTYLNITERSVINEEEENI